MKCSFSLNQARASCRVLHAAHPHSSLTSATLMIPAPADTISGTEMLAHPFAAIDGIDCTAPIVPVSKEGPWPMEVTTFVGLPTVNASECRCECEGSVGLSATSVRRTHRVGRSRKNTILRMTVLVQQASSVSAKQQRQMVSMDLPRQRTCASDVQAGSRASALCACVQRPSPDQRQARSLGSQIGRTIHSHTYLQASAL